MQELELSKELYIKIVAWMTPKYSINTIKQYSVFMKKMFKQYKILNKESLIKITRTLKHQNQRAVLCLINDFCYENDIDFHINIPKVKRQAAKLPEILSPEEIKLIIQSAPKPYDLAIRCIFNMGAGLRISEIIKFSWNHIRWIDWINNKNHYGVAIIKSGKGSKDRVVNIPTKLMNDLYEYAKELKLLNEFGIPVGGMIFDFGTSEFEEELFEEDLELWKNEYVRHCYNWFRYNILQKHCEKALNRKFKIHSLRHSRSTYLYEIEGVPIEKIQILLGHASLNTTMLYTKVNPRKVFELIKNTNEI